MSTENPLLNYSPQALREALAKVEEKTTNDRKAYKDLVDQSIPGIAAGLVNVSETLSKCKTLVFSAFEDILQLKGDVYGIKEDQQSHTFTTDDYSVTVGFRINDAWDDTVTAGIAKVKGYLNSLAKDDETAVLVNSVLRLLAKNRKGDLQANKVLELQAMAEEYKNEMFTDGVNIILKSYKPTRGNWFIEAYTISDGVKTSIPLGIAAVDFEPGYTFDFFKKPSNDI